MMNTLRRITVGAALTVGLVAPAAPAAASTPTTPPAASTTPGVAPAAAELAAFFDTVVPAQLAEHGIPGAAVVVVAGGEQVFAGGYGVADLATGEPVDPHTTVFFAASTMKLLTATAVMQQVEAGRLDLHRDVNRYLTTFQIDDTYPGQPITPAHLLTHTAGFDENPVGIATAEPEELPSLADYLAAHQPSRVRPPGRLASYSNYGLALAGHLVEEVTGTPFAEYMREHVTEPLGMTRTTFAQPLPPEIEADLAVGHDADREPVAGQYSPLSPAGGGAVATVTDLGRFMLAHLRGGELDGARVLAAETVALMRTRQFGHDDRLPGMAYAFIERYRNGHRLLTHGGDSLGFHGNLAMLPEQGAGIYVVYNGDGVAGGAALAAERLVEQFVDRFYPGRPPASDGTEPEPARFAGSYRTTRVSHDDFTRIIALFSAVTVTAGTDGNLTTSGSLALDGRERRWRPVGPALFEEVGGQQRLAFAVDDQGRVEAMFVSSDPTVAYERLAWYSSPTLHMGLAGSALLVLAAAFVGIPLAAAWRAGTRRLTRREPAAHRTGGRWPRLAAVLGWCAAALPVAFALGLAALLGDADALFATIVLGGSPALSAVLALPVLAAAATAGALAAAVAAWRRRWWSRWRRLRYSATVLAAVTFLGVAANYQLVV